MSKNPLLPATQDFPKRPGATQQQNQLLFGQNFRPTPESAGQVHRFLQQKLQQEMAARPQKTKPHSPTRVIP